MALKKSFGEFDRRFPPGTTLNFSLMPEFAVLAERERAIARDLVELAANSGFPASEPVEIQNFRIDKGAVRLGRAFCELARGTSPQAIDYSQLGPGKSKTYCRRVDDQIVAKTWTLIDELFHFARGVQSFLNHSVCVYEKDTLSSDKVIFLLKDHSKECLGADFAAIRRENEQALATHVKFHRHSLFWKSPRPTSEPPLTAPTSKRPRTMAPEAASAAALLGKDKHVIPEMIKQNNEFHAFKSQFYDLLIASLTRDDSKLEALAELKALPKSPPIYVRVRRGPAAPAAPAAPVAPAAPDEADEARLALQSEVLFLEALDAAARSIANEIFTKRIQGGGSAMVDLGEASFTRVNYQRGQGNLSFAFTTATRRIPEKFQKEQQLGKRPSSSSAAPQNTTLRVRATHGVRTNTQKKLVQDEFPLSLEEATETVAQYVATSVWRIGVPVAATLVEVLTGGEGGPKARLLFLVDDLVVPELLNAAPTSNSEFHTLLAPGGPASQVADKKKQAEVTELTGLWNFLVKISACGLFFVDAHIGNVMWEPESSTFRIIDFDSYLGTHVLHHSDFLVAPAAPNAANNGEDAEDAEATEWSPFTGLLSLNVLNFAFTLAGDGNRLDIFERFLLLPHAANSGKALMTRGDVLEQMVESLAARKTVRNACERLLLEKTWQGGFFGEASPQHPWETPWPAKPATAPTAPTAPTATAAADSVDPTDVLDWMLRINVSHRAVKEPVREIVRLIELRQRALYTRTSAAAGSSGDAPAAPAAPDAGSELNAAQMTKLFAGAPITIRQQAVDTDCFLRTITARAVGPLIMHAAPIREGDQALPWIDFLRSFVFKSRRQTIPGQLLRARMPYRTQERNDDLLKEMKAPFLSFRPGGLPPLAAPGANAQAEVVASMDTSA